MSRQRAAARDRLTPGARETNKAIQTLRQALVAVQSGTLPGGIDFNGSNELKQILLARGDQFVETLAGKVMMYALGRGLEPFDRPAVSSIARSVKEQHNGFASLIEAVVMSETFRTCRGREESK